MQSLPADYLSEIARNLVFVCAFLGGFAATFLVELLSIESDRPQAGWAIGSAAISASAFIVAVVALTGMVVTLHPNAPPLVTHSPAIFRARVMGLLGLVVGLYALLVSMGLSGWLRSRRIGIVTSVVAGAGAVITTWALLGFR